MFSQSASIWLTLGYCSWCVFCCKNFFQEIIFTCYFLKALKRSVLKKAWERETQDRRTSRQKRRWRADGKSHKILLHTFFHEFTHMSAQTYMCAQKRTQTQKKRNTLTDHKHTLVSKDAQTDTDLGEKRKKLIKKWKDKYTSLHLNLLLPKRQQLSAVFCGRLSTTGKKVVLITYLGLSKTQQL